LTSERINDILFIRDTTKHKTKEVENAVTPWGTPIL